MRASFLAAFAAFLLLLAQSAGAQSFRFNAITVEGNVRVDNATVISGLGITPGQTVSASELSAGVSRLSALGLFEDVDVTPRGNTLVVSVVEYPIIGIVNFEGNRRINDDALLEVVQIRSGRVLSPSVVEADARAIAELYNRRARIGAEVTPVILPRGNNRVDLAFEIREGNVAELERVSFVGNRAFSNYRLRQVLPSKQAGVFRWLVQSDTFIAERIAADRQALTDFYLNRGYVDFEVLSVTSELSRERDGFFLTFNLREGLPYRFGNVTVVSEVEGQNAADYERELRVRPGVLFTPRTLEQNIARLELLAERRGLRFIRAEPRFTRNDRTQTIDVEFAIVRGERLIVERIDIQGNTTTQDRVIRRQFRKVEGDPFNPRELREAAQRIRDLGYFDARSVSVDARAGSAPDQAIIDVEVEETTTGSLGFSLSYSQSIGVGFGITFAETNFLGRGQRVNIAFNTVPGSRDISLSFVDPGFLDRDLTFGLDIGYQETRQQNSNFNTASGFLNNSLGFAVGEYSNLELRRSLTLERLDGLDKASSARLNDDQRAGRTITSSIGYTFAYDTRKVGIDPSRGWFFTFGQDIGGGTGGRAFLRTEASAGFEYAAFNEDVIFNVDAMAGVLHMARGASRMSERYQLVDFVRGFRAGEAGPRDFGARNRDVLGGNRYAAIKADVRFPLGTPEEYGLSGGAFVDAGAVWGVDRVRGRAVPAGFGQIDMRSSNRPQLRAAAGVSLFWDSPLGLLRFDFSRPVRKQASDRAQNFDFSIVSRF